ncbi:MAG TPA: RHS repeat-associated core domain-containing protein [Baekduia sp.]
MRTLGAGSAVTTTYAYNAANELCWAFTGTSANPCGSVPSGATTYAYDPAGNRTTGSVGYDALSRLTSLAGTSLDYLSPGSGELTSYGTTSFQNNIMGLSREIRSSGSTNTLIRQPNGALVAQRVGTTSKQWIFTDNLGSTVAMADSASNTLARRYTYTPDGDPSTSGTGATTDVQYAGGQRISNLYHYGARYYDPLTASWTQQDPINQIGSLGQANRYSYAAGDPVNGSDPSGALSFSVGVDLGPDSVGVTVNHDFSSHVYRQVTRLATHMALTLK